MGSVLDRLLKFTAIRPRSEKEIKQRLARKKIPEEEKEKVLAQLKRLGLVDDRAFANWWVDERLTFRPRSKKFLAFELSQKGVKREVISDVLEEKDLDEVELARKALAKKKLTGRKAFSYLLRLGFGAETIREVVDEKASEA